MLASACCLEVVAEDASDKPPSFADPLWMEAAAAVVAAETVVAVVVVADVETVAVEIVVAVAAAEPVGVGPVAAADAAAVASVDTYYRTFGPCAAASGPSVVPL